MGNKSINIIIILLLLNIMYIYNNNQIIIIPLKRINIPDSNLNYIESLLQNQLYAEIKLGTPEQNIYLSISTETAEFSIESSLINNKFYSYNKSSTHVNTEKKLSFYQEKYKSGYIFKDSFYFLNEYSIKNIFKTYDNIAFDCIFELSEEYNKEKKYCIDDKNNLISGVIGLQIPKSYDTSSNILNSLSNLGAIDNNIWSLLYSDIYEENKVFLIIGKDPFQNTDNDDNNKKDNKNNYNEPKRANAFTNGIDSYWYFIFSDIKTGNVKLNQERTAEYAPQLGVIIGTAEYKKYINNTFFANLIKDNLCSGKSINTNGKKYLYYECDRNININNFESIVFTHQEFSYNFILDKNDLFINVNDKKYFLCVFVDNDEEEEAYYSNKHWILGEPFYKKYNFVFDQNSKNILFYEEINSENNDEEINIYALIIAIILISLILAVGIYFLFKVIFRPKRIQANELEDTFNYNKQKNGPKETDLTSFYNSKYSQLGI